MTKAIKIDDGDGLTETIEDIVMARGQYGATAAAVKSALNRMGINTSISEVKYQLVIAEESGKMTSSQSGGSSRRWHMERYAPRPRPVRNAGNGPGGPIGAVESNVVRRRP